MLRVSSTSFNTIWMFRNINSTIMTHSKKNPSIQLHISYMQVMLKMIVPGFLALKGRKGKLEIMYSEIREFSPSNLMHVKDNRYRHIGTEPMYQEAKKKLKSKQHFENSLILKFCIVCQIS